MVVGATISRAARRCRPLLIGSASSVTPTCRRAGDAPFPRGHRFYWKAEFLRAIPDAAIEMLLDRFPTVPSPHSFFVFQQVGGAIAQVALGATAYINRDAAYDCFPVSIWTDPGDDAAKHRMGAGALHCDEAVRDGGIYVNNLGDEGEDRIREAYGSNYDRLAALKRKYDPDNLFRRNQNIRPNE